MLPTPLPGWIPLSVIWIHLLTLPIFEAARASTIITKSGLISLHNKEIISKVSIPLFPITPGLKLEVHLTPSLTSSPSKNKCLVTTISSTTLGPKLSGVLSLLPSPIISTLLTLLISKISLSSGISSCS